MRCGDVCEGQSRTAKPSFSTTPVLPNSPVRAIFEGYILEIAILEGRRHPLRDTSQIHSREARIHKSVPFAEWRGPVHHRVSALRTFRQSSFHLQTRAGAGPIS